MLAYAHDGGIGVVIVGARYWSIELMFSFSSIEVASPPRALLPWATLPWEAAAGGSEEGEDCLGNPAFDVPQSIVGECRGLNGPSGAVGGRVEPALGNCVLPRDA